MIWETASRHLFYTTLKSIESLELSENVVKANFPAQNIRKNSKQPPFHARLGIGILFGIRRRSSKKSKPIIIKRLNRANQCHNEAAPAFVLLVSEYADRNYERRLPRR